MKRAILLVDHGSRRPEAGQVIEEIAAALRRRQPDWRVEVAHLELVPPDVATGIDTCVAAGASEIVLHPYFLAPGMHTTHDLPELVEAARERHPQVAIHVTPPLGFDEKLVDLVLQRVSED